MKPTKEESGEESDVDQDFLDQVLNKLYDFGDGTKGKRGKKKPKKRKRGNDEEVEEEEKIDESSNVNNDEADLSDNSDERVTTSTSSESTSNLPATKTSDVEIVTFQDPLKRNKVKKAVEPEAKQPEVKDKKKKDPDDLLSIEKARLDVHRFGISGFQKQQQRVFEQDRAIMLGARPPKKDYVNYKLYQQMIKEKKLKEKEEVKSDTPGKKKKSGKPGKQKPEKRKTGSGGESVGHMGHFKNGMLVLSNKDIQKLKVKVRK